MTEQKPIRFFITHSWHDNDFTLKLTNDLRAHGFDGFLDVYSIKLGDDIPLAINRGLEACDVYIPILSSASLKSKWCEREINAALMLSGESARGGRPLLIPVLAEDCARNLPPLLKPILYIAFFNRYADALKDLLAGLDVLRGSEPTTVVAPTPKPRIEKRSVARKTKTSIEKETQPATPKPSIAPTKNKLPRGTTEPPKPATSSVPEHSKLYADLQTAETNQDWNAVVTLGEKILAFGNDAKLNARVALAYHERAIKHLNANVPAYDLAKNDLNRALELEPGNARYYYSRGTCVNNQRFKTGTGDYAHALADYTRAIELDPTRPEFYAERGRAYRNAGDWKKALADGWDVMRLAGMKKADWQTAGWEQFHKANYNWAIAYFTRGLEELVDDDSLAGRGVSYYQKGDYAHALDDLTRAIQLNPKQATYYFWRAMCYENQKNFDRALAELDHSIQLKPKNLAMYLQTRGRIYYLKLDYARAIADCTRALELDAQYASAYFVRGVVYRDQGDTAHALDDFTHALQHDSAIASYHRERGKIFMARGDRNSARRDLQKASELGDAEAKGLLKTL